MHRSFGLELCLQPTHGAVTAVIFTVPAATLRTSTISASEKAARTQRSAITSRSSASSRLSAVDNPLPLGVGDRGLFGGHDCTSRAPLMPRPASRCARLPPLRRLFLAPFA